MQDPVNFVDPAGLAWWNDWHYNRNQFNKVVSFEEAKKNWIEMSPAMSLYHRQGPGNENNLKFVSKNGRYEVVFHPNGVLVTDPVNMGTYNYVSPFEYYGIGHLLADVLPYLVLGNTPDDPTTFWERLTGSYGGLGSSNKMCMAH